MLHFPQRLFFPDMVCPQEQVQGPDGGAGAHLPPSSLSLSSSAPGRANLLKCILQNPSFLDWSSLPHPTILQSDLPFSFVSRLVEICTPQSGGTYVRGFLLRGAGAAAICASVGLFFLPPFTGPSPPPPAPGPPGCFPSLQRWHRPHLLLVTATLFPQRHAQLSVLPVAISHEL